MTTKVLNLDALEEESRTITLGGVTHNVVGLSVEGFIKMQKVIEALNGSEETSDKLKTTVEMICVAVPTMDKEALMSMKIERVGMIARFVNGESPEEINPSAADEAAEGEAKK